MYKSHRDIRFKFGSASCVTVNCHVYFKKENIISVKETIQYFRGKGVEGRGAINSPDLKYYISILMLDLIWHDTLFLGLCGFICILARTFINS